MTRIAFTPNDRRTLGVEVELPLIDARTLSLKSAYPAIAQDVPIEYAKSVKHELMQCYLELNTKVCHTVAEVREDLSHKLALVEKIGARHQTRLLWSATHPFSLWFDQEITPDERYYSLVEKMQDTARRIVTFGLHIHVGVESGDKAVMLQDRLMRYLPMLLGLSVNSPFWVGRQTGLHSHRVQVMAALPAAGLPPVMRNWSEYCWIVNHSIESNFINSQREIWWDLRPHAGFGTIEIRIFDLPPCLDDVVGLTALCQCLVQRLSEEIDEGVYQHDIHPMLVRQNKWKASRYGMDADLTDPVTRKTIPLREQVHKLYEKLRPYAESLGCATELDHVPVMLDRPSGAARQLALLEETGNLRGVIRGLLGDSLSPTDLEVAPVTFPACD